MTKFYTVFYIRKTDNKVLRRYNTNAINKYFWEKTKLEQLNKVLEIYPELDKRDIIVKDYDGTVEDHD